MWRWKSINMQSIVAEKMKAWVIAANNNDAPGVGGGIYKPNGRPVETSTIPGEGSPQPGGSLRIHVADADLARSILRAAVALPLLSAGLGPEVERGDGLALAGEADDPACRSFLLGGTAAWPDGVPVVAADVIEAWEDPKSSNSNSIPASRNRSMAQCA